MKIRATFLCLITILGMACQTEEKITPEEARQIAKEAYIYGFPMAVNYKTMYLYALDTNSPEYKGPFNEVSCEARLFTPQDRAVVTPNSFTPYCMFWVDLRQEPQIFTVPEVESDRYYSFQLIDLYTHNFAYLGTLTTGNSAGNYLIATSDWAGPTPAKVKEVIRCETDLFFVIVRTQLMHAQDMEQVRQIQNAYTLQGLSAFLGQGPKTPSSEQASFPVWNEGDQFTPQAFTYLDVMFKLLNPSEEEKPMLEKFARLGIGTEEGFDINRFSPEVQEAIRKGVEEGFADIEAFIGKIGVDPLASAKVFGTRGFLEESARKNYGLEEFYLLRAAAAHLGLYGNSGFEAIYPTYLSESPGVPFDASQFRYTLTFEKGQLPPVKAFWSLSMYDGKTQLFIDNPLNRYLLNSGMLEDFVYNEDGSLTFYVQKDPPEKALEANWLPAPDGPFYCVMRLYGPKEEALSEEWKNPPLKKGDPL